MTVPSERREKPTTSAKVYPMATSGCSRVKYISISKKAFYFEVADIDGGIEEDKFEKSECELQHLIGNEDNKFVIINADEEFQVQSLTMTEQSEPDNKFNIQFYKDNSLEERRGRAVILYVIKDKKKMVACCNTDGEIFPVEMDLPKKIGESAHMAVFFQRKLKASNKVLLESSLCPSQFMGFEPDEEDSSVCKLALLRNGDLSEKCHICLS